MVIAMDPSVPTVAQQLLIQVEAPVHGGRTDEMVGSAPETPVHGGRTDEMVGSSLETRVRGEDIDEIVGGRGIDVFVDGVLIGSTARSGTVAWPPTPGRHVLRARGADMDSGPLQIEVVPF
jgi:hypothetical protein